MKNKQLTLTNTELVMYVLGILGGEYRPVHTEDIAVKAHQTFPHSFSWTNYPDLPDKEITRRALIHARDGNLGTLVEGRTGRGAGRSAISIRNKASDGWMLTEDGMKWFGTRSEEIAKHIQSGELKAHRQKALKRVSKIVNHDLYNQYVQQPDEFHPSIGELARFLRCRVDAPPDIWEKRFFNLERDSKSVHENLLLEEFINKCRDAYSIQI